MAAQGQVNIAGVCRQLGYSKQAYYKSLNNKARKPSHSAVVTARVLAIRRQMPRLGVRKLYHLLQGELRSQNIAIGRDKLFALLRQQGLLVQPTKKRVQTTNSKHWMRKYPNLVKTVSVVGPEQVWVADITYLSLRQGHCFLHLVTDVYSKKIMGYTLSGDLSAVHTLGALQQALKQRQYDQPLIHHSDRGLQYCSNVYVQELQKNQMAISMTQDGNPYDNAIAERVNGILKQEFGLYDCFENMKQAALQVHQAVITYNQQRPHLSCAMLTPQAMHQQQQVPLKSWHKKSTRTLVGSCAFLPSSPIY